MSDIPYADLIILALIAGFILLRLRSVLGSKPGDDFFAKKQQSAADRLQFKQDPVVQLDEKSLKPKPKEEADAYLMMLADGPVAESLRQIKSKDPQFTATGFLQGAKAAFEMVFDAFVKGDRQTLKMLLSDPIFQHFSHELDNRTKQENKSETTLVSVIAKDITQAISDKNMARLTVHFESEQVTVIRGPKGNIVEGNPSELHHVEDQWTFERDLTSKNPNWKIIET